MVVTQARVRCLICTHNVRGRTYRQRTSACVTTNMLYFRHCKICPNRLATVLTLYIVMIVGFVFERCHDIYLYGIS